MSKKQNSLMGDAFYNYSGKKAMAKCEYCGKEVLYPFECSFCGGKFCIEHRLPENHDCIRSPKRTPLGPWYAKKTPKGKPIKIPSKPLPTSKKRVASEGKFHFVKGGSDQPKRRPVKKIIGVFAVVIIIGLLLWNAPTIISYIQNLSSPTDSSNESYMELTLRDLPMTEVNTTVIEFGDTEYTFDYLMGYLHVYTFIGGSKNYIPHEGDAYRDFGIEMKVSDVDSDYISKYIVILVKPTVQNYSASLYYTKVKIPLHQTKAVDISSGLINKTNRYWFSYAQIAHPTFNEPQLTIKTGSQSKSYVVIAGFTIRDFEIETRVYKIESEFMVIYVKPLY
jgi:hypothetical protein